MLMYRRCSKRQRAAGRAQRKQKIAVASSRRLVKKKRSSLLRRQYFCLWTKSEKRTEDGRTHGKPLLASHRHADAIGFDCFACNSSRSGLSLRSITAASPHVPFVSATMPAELKKKVRACKARSRVQRQFSDIRLLFESVATLHKHSPLTLIFIQIVRLSAIVPQVPEIDVSSSKPLLFLSVNLSFLAFLLKAKILFERILARLIAPWKACRKNSVLYVSPRSDWDQGARERIRESFQLVDKILLEIAEWANDLLLLLRRALALLCIIDDDQTSNHR